MMTNPLSDKQIQQLYNKTKEINSPPDLDALILGKVRQLEEPVIVVESIKKWGYFAVAASILFVVLLQLKDGDNREKSVEIAKIPNKPKIAPRNQLPDLFLLPHQNINNKVVPACTAELITPEERLGLIRKPKKPNSKQKPSKIPIQPMYPTNGTKKNPSCDSVSGRLFKHKEKR